VRDVILRIDPTHSVPVYAQIVDQVKRAIASGTLRSGEPLPSLRETAVNLRVNPLTVNKAYKLLEHDGLVETRHGLGTFIAAGVAEAAEGYSIEVLARSIDSLILDAANLRVPLEKLRGIFEERIEAAKEDR
jgi:GntR family transcriptional regulator